jgi:ubiquinone/menaquinone biosynthesis C-methylase UbiE
MTQQVDAGKVKQQQKKDWGEAAAGWQRYDEYLMRTTAPITEMLLDLAQVGPGKRVLDVACGTGEPALPAAKMVGPTGFVLATDMAPEMIEVAREKARAQGVANVEFRLVDGEELGVEPGSFDSVTCRFGIMFMPEPLKFFYQAYQALKPGGRIAVTVWGPPERNPWITLPMSTVRKHVEVPAQDPTAPGGVFSFADRSKLEFIFQQAGFGDIRVDSIELPMAAWDSGYDYWQHCTAIMGPLRALLETIPKALRDQIGEEVATAAGGGDPNGKVSMPGNPLLGSARK